MGDKDFNNSNFSVGELVPGYAFYADIGGSVSFPLYHFIEFINDLIKRLIR